MRRLMMSWVVSLVGMGAAAQAGEPVEISLDGLWDFTYTASSAEAIPARPPASAFDVQVQVPGRWDDQWDRFKKATWWADATFATSMAPVKYLTGVGWYRKGIDVPAAWRDRAVSLTIGWAVGTTHVWLNGTHLGSYDYGVYTPYEVDLTNHVKCGQENEIIISVDNAKEAFAGGWAFLSYAGKASGITRSVTLRASAGAGRIADVYVRPGSNLRNVLCQAELEVPGGAQHAPASTLLWEVREADKQMVLARGTANVPAFEKRHNVTITARVDRIKPWSPTQPNLHWMNLRWVPKDGPLWDARAQRFGLRRFTLDGRKLKLNGRDLYLRGEFGAYYFPVHCTTPTTREYWIAHIRRAKQIGMNYINFAARVCPIEMMEVADELGIILQCGDHMTVLEPYAKFYEAVWQPIVRWTRKHPSLCFYGFGGERNYYDGIIEQYQRQHDLIKSLHPESLVMPQQAIRGIDYAFDEKGRKALTREPFPHHAERLAQYTKACDLFGHYSGGAFGYSYFSTRWQEMEKRFLIYSKPLVMHELFMGMSYLNPDNADKYTGFVPPALYTKLRDDLTEAGLIDRWHTYHVNSAKLQGICKKYCIEKTRKCNELAGFEFLGMTDMHFMPHYTVGILDEFMQLKPGDTVAGILRYNGPSVLLLDYAEGSINRSFGAGEPFDADVMVSLFEANGIAGGKLRWTLNQGQRTVFEDACAVSDIAAGGVRALRKLTIRWPAVAKTTRLNLAVKLTAPACDLANDWDFWVFPKQNPPAVAADTDEKTYALLSDRYKNLSKPTDTPADKLRIVSQLREGDVQHLAAGGDVLLLGTKPLAEYTSWRSFRPGLGGRHHHNVGTVIAQHPIFDHLPHDGWGDWQFYPVLEHASCILFDADLPTPFDPILEIISSGGDVRRQAAIFEKRVGQGRLLVSTCVANQNNPSCVALTDGMLRYAGSDAFRPKSELSLETLVDLMTPVDARDLHNHVAAPGFERAREIKSAWLTYGADYAIDDAIARTGKRSLKLTITPEQLKSNAGHYTGAQAKDIPFRKSPSAFKLSAWHKTKDLTGKKEQGFLIFVYITYAEGGRHTLRLHFETGTHDWQYAETTWKPTRKVASARLYVGLAHQSGMAWVDDIYFGQAGPDAASAPAVAKLTWHRKPVTIDLKAGSWFRLDAGPWTSGARLQVAEQGIHKLAIKKNQDDPNPEIREIRIDTTPPTIELATHPALDQEGGVYFATPDTTFRFNARDALSGLKTIEVSVDGQAYIAHSQPLNLPTGRHTLRCRATDLAGNRSDIITGEVLSGGKTTTLDIRIR